jgi:histidine ammonia-lyase
VVEAVRHVLAIELLCGAQGLEFRKPLRPGKGVLKAFEAVRSAVPRLTQDRPIGPDIECVVDSVMASLVVV